MSLTEAVAYALAPAALPQSPEPTAATSASPLTPREHEVEAWVAEQPTLGAPPTDA